MDDKSQRGAAGNDSTTPPKYTTSPMSVVLNLLVLAGIVVVAACLMLPVGRSAPEAARRNSCANNLKQIGLALQGYYSFHHAFPPAYTTDADGKPLHSWRTLILPFMEQQPLYDSIDLTKPWDDPANAKARETLVGTYQCPSALMNDGDTTYLAVVTPSSCFRATQSRSLSDISDGEAQTLMIVEVDSKHAVPWMSPNDADESVVLGIGANSKPIHSGGVNSVFVDGHVQFLPADMPADQRRALISIAGNDNAP